MTIRTAIKPLGGGKIKIDTTPIRFDYKAGAQLYQVPLGCKKLHIDCVGGTHSGKGGRVQCVLSVKPKQNLFIIVAQSNANGYNASDVRTIENDLYSRLVVAGGGGEAGKQGTASSGGLGGGLIGGASASTSSGGASSGGASGGTQTAGGTGGARGTGYKNEGVSGAQGTFGLGGAGGNTGGHGGAGWHGGGGGAYTIRSGVGTAVTTSGGGGGSSYTHPELCSEVIHTQGFNPSGNGYVIITPMEK